MKKLFLIFFFLSGCTYSVSEKRNIIPQISYSEDLSLEQFKIKLDEYSINNPYPNIDK